MFWSTMLRDLDFNIYFKPFHKFELYQKLKHFFEDGAVPSDIKKKGGPFDEKSLNKG